MEKMGLSPLQRAPVLDDRSPLLVSAGAGSGKTRLLVAYFVRALTDEGLAPEQLVAVTFTRKAAAELVARIRTALEESGRADLARTLDRTTIGTIHSLCSRLVHERALQIDTDPAAAVLEADAASVLKERISRQVWDSVAERSDQEHLGVLALWGAKLRKQIVPLYDRLRGLGVERPQVVVSGQPEAGRAPLGGLAVDAAAAELTQAVRAALAAAAEAPRITATLRKDLDSLERCLDWLGASLTLEQRAMALDDTADFFPSRKTSSAEPYFRPVRLMLTRYRETLARLRLWPLVEVMNLLLAEFHDAYEAHKLEKGLLDFADLELRAHRLVAAVVADAGGILPPASRLLIDEFQDTNALQYSILSGLGASRLLMVGDARQSIYRFRGADVGVFRGRESELDPPRPGESHGRVHRLDVNYRSRPEVLAFVNALFAHESFFGDRFVPLREPDGHGDNQLRRSDGVPVDSSGGDPRSTSSDDAPRANGVPAVEVVVVERCQGGDDATVAEPAQEAEAKEVALRVRRLIDEEGWTQREITILIPAQTHVEAYQRALVSRGIDVYVVGGKGYYSQEEVSDVIALLRLLVNPHDDLALVAALRSPLVGISDDGLYLLGREGRRTRISLWEAVRNDGQSLLRSDDARRLGQFTERLLALRARVGRPGIAGLIDEAISSSDYDLCLLALGHGRRRFANIRKMMRMASDFEALEGPDLAGFVELVESMDDLSDREGSAPILAEGEDVVRIMTVHQAKGLEFPVVLLAALGSDVRTSDAADFMVADDGRAGVFLRGSARDRYEDQDLSLGPAADVLESERAKEREEDIRLLYVAMTRAEKRLILVGAKPSAGAMEKSRIGRVLHALDIDTMPAAGSEASLPDLDAVIVAPACLRPEETGQTLRPGRHLPAVPPPASLPDELAPFPQFMETDHRARGPRRISFSTLAAYRRCPRGYYLERLLGLDLGAAGSAAHSGTGALVAGGSEVDADIEPAIAELVLDEHELRAGQEIGLAVHALLERLPVGLGCPSADLTHELAAAWLEETGVVLRDADLQTVVRLTRAFWESPFAGVRDVSDAAKEAPFLFVQGGWVVSGVMDLLHRHDGLWHIVDYKTNALAGRTPAQMAANYELQAVVYCLAALRSGARTARMDFVFLEQPGTPVTFEYSLESVAGLAEIIDAELIGLEQNRFDRAPGKQCDECAVHEVCEIMAPGSPDGIQ